ncbi:zinc finger transcription factor [Paramyrothecium foliicola]|nr:zinc finger transcription factor [Paramyrothecium foliicola]
MHNGYKAAYLGVIDDSIMNQDLSTAAGFDDESSNDFRPLPGDEYPSLPSMPSLQASVKFATGDVSARSIDVQFIWQQLSSDWPYELVEFDALSGQSLGSHISYSILENST